MLHCCYYLGMIIARVTAIIYPVTYSIEVIDCFADHHL